MAPTKGLGCTRKSDFSKWYNAVVAQAGLAEHSPARGCMIIKPYGYAIWEKLQGILDKMFKDTGHSNVYFPLFIPQSYLEKEASHVAGFAKECAIVTHYRLQEDKEGLRIDPNAVLEEPMVVRPTSETMIWQAYRRWIQSHRDLPLLLNQWANVVRWEMRTRFFLRTTEFLWQEGHTAHATKEEAIAEARRMLGVYRHFVEEYMGISVLEGRKSERERFPGAEDTLCLEALMQDGRSLQMGTSHFLGQNFARAFDVQFSTPQGTREYVWGTSWGVSARLIGAMIMSHSDDKGLIIPPKLAPIEAVIVPIYRSEEENKHLHATALALQKRLQAASFSIKYDAREVYTPGWKFSEYELQGVPLQIIMGPKEAKENVVELRHRWDGTKEQLPNDDSLPHRLRERLSAIQTRLLARSKERLTQQSAHAENYADFKAKIQEGGMVWAHWDGTQETEARIQEETQATLRVLPFETPSYDKKAVCMVSGKASVGQGVFAKAY